MAIIIRVVCPKCGGEEFDDDKIVNKHEGYGYGYACIGCGHNIGDDGECYPLKFINIDSPIDKLRRLKARIEPIKS